MSLKRSGLLLVVLLSQVTPPLHSDGTPQILLPGAYYSNLAYGLDGTWFGLCGQKMELDQVNVTVKELKTAEDGEVQYPQYEIRTDGCDKPRFLVRNINGLKEGPLKSATMDGIEDGQQINFGGQKYSIKEDRLGKTGFQLTLGHQVNKNSLVKIEDQQHEYDSSLQPEDYRPIWEIIWAGDLDNDGKLDLVIDAAQDARANHYHLYLSGAAGQKQIVNEVADFEIPLDPNY